MNLLYVLVSFGDHSGCNGLHGALSLCLPLHGYKVVDKHQLDHWLCI